MEENQYESELNWNSWWFVSFRALRRDMIMRDEPYSWDKWQSWQCRLRLSTSAFGEFNTTTRSKSFPMFRSAKLATVNCLNAIGFNETQLNFYRYTEAYIFLLIYRSSAGSWDKALFPMMVHLGPTITLSSELSRASQAQLNHGWVWDLNHCPSWPTSDTSPHPLECYCFWM